MSLKDSTKSKNGSRGTNGFFMCFRPVDDLEPDRPVRAYVASMAESDGGVVLRRSDRDGLSFERQEDGTDFAGKKIGRSSSSSRRFSRAWKAVFVEPAKKTKTDKKSQISLTIERARYNCQEPSSNKDVFDFGRQRISRSVSALTTSSSASNETSKYLICPSCSSRITETPPPFELPNPNRSGKQNGIDGTKKGHFYYNYSCNVGLLLMLISLVVLVFWGKVCAIFCTATLFFVPRGLVNDNHRRNANSSLTLKLSESKRKIVMEGL